MKICSKCKIEKPKTEFYKDARKPDGLQSKCSHCGSEASKAHYKANKERLIALAAAWRTENKERLSAIGKEYYKANKELIASKKKAYREENQELIAAYRSENKARRAETDKAWREANKERIAATCKAWRDANPDILSAQWRNRRALKRSADGTHTTAEILSIFTSQRGLCASCETKLFKSGNSKFHVDHIVALSNGGSNDKYNLQCLCPSCNLRKNAKDPIDWANENGRLL